MQGVLLQIKDAADVELIVVDSSDDGTTEKLRESFHRFTLIRPKKRLLPGPARNMGVSKAAGDILIFLDGDCLPDRGWLMGFRTAVAQLGKSIVCGSVDLDEPSDLSQFMEYVICKLPENSRMPRGRHRFIITANMMIQKKDFLKTGGFGESDSANDAEMDVARQRSGMDIFFEPAARVFHIHPCGWKYHITKLYRVGQEQFELMRSLKGYRVGRWMVRLFPVVFIVRWLRITWFLLRIRPRWVGRYLSIQPMLWTGLLAHQAGLWRGLFKMILYR